MKSILSLTYRTELAIDYITMRSSHVRREGEVKASGDLYRHADLRSVEDAALENDISPDLRSTKITDF